MSPGILSIILAIAVGGYEDAHIQRIGEGVISSGGGFWPFVIPAGSGGVRPGISLSYAFFPVSADDSPVAVPLVLGLTTIATATLAGVLVSLLGTLAAMLALFESRHPTLGR